MIAAARFARDADANTTTLNSVHVSVNSSGGGDTVRDVLAGGVSAAASRVLSLLSSSEAQSLGKARTAGWLLQMRMLCARFARQVVRHPLLLGAQLGCTAIISALAGAVFWDLDYDLDTGVLTRVGLVFFLGLYFMLTALAPLPLWTHERLLYFHERAAGCYGPLSYVLARTLYDGIMQRVLPATLCAAIVYPTAGLSMSRAAGPYHTTMFVAALCLANLLGTAVITCIAVVTPSTAVTTRGSHTVVPDRPQHPMPSPH